MKKSVCILAPPPYCCFLALWLLIISVSVYDGFCVLATRSTIEASERNPVGWWLIQVGSGDVWLLLAVKAAGTVLAGMLLLRLYTTHSRVAWIACVSVAGFQSLLLCWLVAA
jgi:hypothetical protein